MKALPALVVAFLGAFILSFATASAAPPNIQLPIMDEGTQNGTTVTDGLDCRGNGIACSVEGRTGRITVAAPLAATTFSGARADCPSPDPDDGGFGLCSADDAVGVSHIQYLDAGTYRVFLSTEASDNTYNVQATGPHRRAVGAESLDAGSFIVQCSDLATPTVGDCERVHLLVNDIL